MDFSDGDWGYGLGLLLATLGAAVGLIFGWMWFVPLLVVAFALCWWYA